ncbi:MAG: hypothetical protein A3B96_04100 [Candidatus Spechtbacteria bacterium RIFCSPHIGHO2_02_FULL_43_15b]|uniref:Glycosyltransferase 2-like domain-containing protein n=1 Tax=Candidatus Spechtbacteria bacterium RIFCSPHIGHO2_01_FULL_43_30 TaxID=1802158 RepID=A0A1G2H6R3_9BACT|nr:MAG: hypothetical protein A2827_03935 [Candidatus Spechtbacteria bacterium RIFCSPHIGHO2_01_FULL_43_30]OGZ60403.1 MAG: hypothetical protein A3B96_04100 [Candidatus Spechtbacteria bacterium RIFCSPHIGHO2_02_FULL_43_15b]
MKGKPEKVFVILLNWNNWHETRECLASLEKADYPTFEVIIVDNGSNQKDVAEIKNFSNNVSGFILHILWNSNNLGFAGGNNVGIRYALERGADYVFLLNNDAIVAPDSLTKLVKAGESDKILGILGSRVYKYGTDEVVFDGGKVNNLMTKAYHQPKLTGSDPVSFGVQYVTGAAFLIKREAIEKIGLMREEYFLYYEDVDWCVRARNAGFKCVVVPESKVWHKVSATNKEGSPSYIYYHTRNSLILAKFNGNICQKVCAYLLAIWILEKQVLKFFLVPSRRKWSRAMTRGVLDFLKCKYGQYENPA